VPDNDSKAFTERKRTKVALRTDAYYRNLAQDALRKAGAVEPPVAVEAVASGLGIPLYTTQLPPWFSGALIYEDGMPVILLNEAIGEIGARRTLGHLIGHILVVLEEPGATYPRDKADHHVADVVAAEMTLPSYMVDEQAKKWFNDYRYLARLFGVPESEMLEKMHALGLVKQRGMLWDY
jgi:Zn-dependent peptidase ImmA (M78 family)